MLVKVVKSVWCLLYIRTPDPGACECWNTKYKQTHGFTLVGNVVLILRCSAFVWHTHTHTHIHTHTDKNMSHVTIIQDLFQEKDKQNTISRSGLCRHGNSDMCTWLSKASDIQAPLTESRHRHHHHHHHHHHSTISAAGGSARSETWVCRRRDDGAQNGSLLWSHAESKYNTAG